MVYEKCLTCPAIKEKKCSGPNYMAMSTRDLVEWCIAYQKLNGITNTQLADRSKIPKKTIDGIKYRDDVRHDTIYPIIKALIELVGGTWGGEACASFANDAELLQENARLKHEAETNKKLMEQQEREIERCNRGLRERNIMVFSLIGLCLALVLLF